MTNETLTEAEFKNVLENKVLVLLKHGDWSAKMDMGVKTLKYRNDSTLSALSLFIHAHTVEVVTSGFVVELNNSYLVERVTEHYLMLHEKQSALEKARQQEVVLEAMNKFTYNLSQGKELL